ncbi:hypothetical protein SISSUDRAFT_1055350, partial [Sistotremastrum suecicum HHB10207 ss-3]
MESSDVGLTLMFRKERRRLELVPSFAEIGLRWGFSLSELEIKSETSMVSRHRGVAFDPGPKFKMSNKTEPLSPPYIFLDDVPQHLNTRCCHL